MNNREFTNFCLATMDGINTGGPISIQFLTDICQNILMGVESEQTTVYDATGRLPAIPTVDGVYDYEAPADCWRIASVLVEVNVPNPLLERIYYNYDYYNVRQRSGGNKLEQTKISGINYYIVPFIRSWDATDTTRARYRFTENPGTTTDNYRLWYYPRPARVTSDTSPLAIGPPFDILYLFPCVKRLYQGLQDGDMLLALEDIKRYRKEYNDELNTGAQDTDLESVDHGY